VPVGDDRKHDPESRSRSERVCAATCQFQTVVGINGAVQPRYRPPLRPTQPTRNSSYGAAAGRGHALVIATSSEPGRFDQIAGSAADGP